MKRILYNQMIKENGLMSCKVMESNFWKQCGFNRIGLNADILILKIHLCLRCGYLRYALS